jgi:hypothetical protein
MSSLEGLAGAGDACTNHLDRDDETVISLLHTVDELVELCEESPGTTDTLRTKALSVARRARALVDAVHARESAMRRNKQDVTSDVDARVLRVLECYHSMQTNGQQSHAAQLNEAIRTTLSLEEAVATVHPDASFMERTVVTNQETLDVLRVMRRR